PRGSGVIRAYKAQKRTKKVSLVHAPAHPPAVVHRARATRQLPRHRSQLTNWALSPAAVRSASAKTAPRLPAASPAQPSSKDVVFRLPKFIATGSAKNVGGPNVPAGTGGGYGDPRMDCLADCMSTLNPIVQKMAGTVLAGVAAAGIGTGVVLLLTSPGRVKRAGLLPAFDMDFALRKISTSALWRF
ncbi:MAG TPA: hypothetical protein VGC79_05870, partial [Polyangiaceae bacterium]